jgi:glutamate-ammonia-ligase adenylyltransferase
MSTAPPDRELILQTVTPLCLDVAPDILQDFVGRMDQEYFRHFDGPTIARHIRLSATLTPDHLCELAITEQGRELFELTIVAYDYFAEFATICGLLSAFGLNIEEGQIYTFSEAAASQPGKSAFGGGPRQRPKTRPGLSRKKIVDVFRVQPVRGASFGPHDQRRLAVELNTVIGLLDTGQFEGARHVVNRHLVE